MSKERDGKIIGFIDVFDIKHLGRLGPYEVFYCKVDMTGEERAFGLSNGAYNFVHCLPLNITSARLWYRDRDSGADDNLGTINVDGEYRGIAKLTKYCSDEPVK